MFEEADVKSEDVRLIDLSLAIDASDFRVGKPDLLFHEYSKMLPVFRAPEILNSECAAFENGNDVWSLGCICYNMVTGIPPFFDEEVENLKM